MIRKEQKKRPFAKQRDFIGGYYDYLVDFLYSLKNIKLEKERLKKIAAFKDIHKGEDCFLIGNGPSLNKTDLSLLDDKYKIGLNKIYLLFEKRNFDVDYLVSVNPYVIEQSKDIFENYSKPIFLPKKSQKSKIDLVNSNIVYLNTTCRDHKFSKDLKQNLWQGYTVTYVAMQIAYYMGFKRVFLIGVDHNFVCEGKPNELQKMKGDDQSHFDPNYFKGHQWQLPDLEMSEIAYKLAKKAFEEDGRKIYDATIGGKLTIFPKISYEEALEKCSNK